MKTIFLVFFFSDSSLHTRLKSQCASPVSSLSSPTTLHRCFIKVRPALAGCSALLCNFDKTVIELTTKLYSFRLWSRDYRNENLIPSRTLAETATSILIIIMSQARSTTAALLPRENNIV